LDPNQNKKLNHNLKEQIKMTESKKIVISSSNEFLKYKTIDEEGNETKEKVKLVTILKHEIDPTQKRRDEKGWKESLGYYLLNPKKLNFGLKDLK